MSTEIATAEAHVRTMLQERDAAAAELAEAERESGDRAADVDAAQNVLGAAIAAYDAAPTDRNREHKNRAADEVGRAQRIEGRVASLVGDRRVALENVEGALRRAKSDVLVLQLRAQAAIETLHRAIAAPWATILNGVGLQGDPVAAFVAAGQAIDEAVALSWAASDGLGRLGVTDCPRLNQTHALLPLLEDEVARGNLGIVESGLSCGFAGMALQTFVDRGFASRVLDLLKLRAEWRARALWTNSPRASVERHLELLRTYRTSNEVGTVLFEIARDEDRVQTAEAIANAPVFVIEDGITRHVPPRSQLGDAPGIIDRVVDSARALVGLAPAPTTSIAASRRPASYGEGGVR